MRWEYRIEQVIHDCDTDVEWLNKRGENGWDLVTIWPASTARGEEYWAVFKRSLLDTIIAQIPELEKDHV